MPLGVVGEIDYLTDTGLLIGGRADHDRLQGTQTKTVSGNSYRR